MRRAQLQPWVCVCGSGALDKDRHAHQHRTRKRMQSKDAPGTRFVGPKEAAQHFRRRFSALSLSQVEVMCMNRTQKQVQIIILSRLTRNLLPTSSADRKIRNLSCECWPHIISGSVFARKNLVFSKHFYGFLEGALTSIWHALTPMYSS